MISGLISGATACTGHLSPLSNPGSWQCSAAPPPPQPPLPFPLSPSVVHRHPNNVWPGVYRLCWCLRATRTHRHTRTRCTGLLQPRRGGCPCPCRSHHGRPSGSRSHNRGGRVRTGRSQVLPWLRHQETPQHEILWIMRDEARLSVLDPASIPCLASCQPCCEACCNLEKKAQAPTVMNATLWAAAVPCS